MIKSTEDSDFEDYFYTAKVPKTYKALVAYRQKTVGPEGCVTHPHSQNMEILQWHIQHNQIMQNCGGAKDFSVKFIPRKTN